jgi:hypothetical protein
MPQPARVRSRWTRRALVARLSLAVFAGQTAAVLRAQKKKNEPYAIVAGTVFQENGFSFPGVNVSLAPKNPAQGRKQTATTSFRGEFAFRVPPTPANYVVTASKRGFMSETVEADVPGEGRVDVTITLVAESKK